jgi:hypothetical protein
MAEIFGFVFLFPPSPGLIEGSYLFFVPYMDELNGDLICHKQSFLYYRLNDSMVTTSGHQYHQNSIIIRKWENMPSRNFGADELHKGCIYDCSQPFDIPVS